MASKAIKANDEELYAAIAKAGYDESAKLSVKDARSFFKNIGAYLGATSKLKEFEVTVSNESIFYSVSIPYSLKDSLPSVEFNKKDFFRLDLMLTIFKRTKAGGHAMDITYDFCTNVPELSALSVYPATTYRTIPLSSYNGDAKNLVKAGSRFVYARISEQVFSIMDNCDKDTATERKYNHYTDKMFRLITRCMLKASNKPASREDVTAEIFKHTACLEPMAIDAAVSDGFYDMFDFVPNDEGTVSALISPDYFLLYLYSCFGYNISRGFHVPKSHMEDEDAYDGGLRWFVPMGNPSICELGEFSIPSFVRKSDRKYLATVAGYITEAVNKAVKLTNDIQDLSENDVSYAPIELVYDALVEVLKDAYPEVRVYAKRLTLEEAKDILTRCYLYSGDYEDEDVDEEDA